MTEKNNLRFSEDLLGKDYAKRQSNRPSYVLPGTEYIYDKNVLGNNTLDNMSEHQPTFADNLFGYKDPKTGYSFGGYAAPILNTATAGMNAYLGLKQLGLMKDNLAFQKDAFSKQFEAQRTTTNTELRDRQNARNASGSGYESTDSYMSKYGV